MMDSGIAPVSLRLLFYEAQSVGLGDETGVPLLPPVSASVISHFKGSRTFSRRLRKEI